MYFELQFDDGLTPLIRQMISEKPQWFASSLKSAGFWASQEIKKGIRSGAPGGKAYPAGMSVMRRRDIDDVMYSHDSNRAPKTRYPTLGKLRTAVGYDKRRANEGIVTVGWLSRSAVRIGTWQEKGFFQIVSERMRRMFFGSLVGMKKGTNAIQLPARATYAPMRPIIKKGAPVRVEQRLSEYLAGSTERSHSRRQRIYRVYK